MMPIGGTPIVVHLMRLYADQGFTHFVLAGGHRIEMLNDYFRGRFPEWNVEIVDTGETSGTGERIRRCQPYVGEMFHATYADGLGDVDLHALVNFHEQHGGLATVTAVPLRSQYGTIVSEDTGLVTEFVEKPVMHEHWINAGFFVFSKGVFERWDGDVLESEVLPRLIPLRTLFTFRHGGFWKSMDTSNDQTEFERLYKSGEAPWIRSGLETAPQEAKERLASA
jgi:glucose-1-phosphate cytidylyltransferase